MSELAIAALLCNLLSGGETEVRHEFPNLGQPRAVRIDCETPSHVIEIGLDETPSVRDSVHQAVFGAFLTGKTPVVVLIDRDGHEGRYEYEMRIVASRLGIPFARCSKSFVEAWNATAPWRPLPLDKSLDDLPQTTGTRVASCDLGPVLAGGPSN